MCCACLDAVGKLAGLAMHRARRLSKLLQALAAFDRPAIAAGRPDGVPSAGSALCEVP